MKSKGKNTKYLKQQVHNECNFFKPRELENNIHIKLPNLAIHSF